ncbi:MAG: 1-deoxy-D-xylulose-5-phosphate synthase [Leptospiraceae bacterium]|nr:1-deoxy-D-xylulose-5-phosphate synthase [Leptospiraceae bacterium]
MDKLIAKYPLLKEVEYPADLRKLPLKALPRFCDELRNYLIDTLSEVGGHFASNLGVIELTVALHYVLDTPNDKLIWDVGHQIYPHKILTGRRARLRSVRRKGGLSGFPKRSESEYDLYNTGHAGTSISQLLGEAVARDIQGLQHHCACVIGDASIASGMAFEALNHGGHIKTNCLVILNDNDHSISPNVGALNQYLNSLIMSPLYNKSRRLWYHFLMWLPVLGPIMQHFSHRVERSIKDLLTPGGFFSDLGFRYFGPVNGADVLDLVRALNKVLKVKGPVLLHAYTQKGKGYEPAEKNPITYHSVSKFNREDGRFEKKIANGEVSYSQIVGETLLELAQKNEKLVAITPAMIEGSGLRPLYDAMPERVHDVGIAEQHSMAYAGALAAGGVVPYLCIYSTFLNRALDQLVEDVALMKFPVRMVVDRAGCVGPDGETHQGLYDVGMLLAMPHTAVYAPATGGELKAMLEYMEHYAEGPIAVRFPKASCHRSSLVERPDLNDHRPLLFGDGTDMAIVAIGVLRDMALKAQAELAVEGVHVRVINVTWIRPLDFEALAEMLAGVNNFIIVEDSYILSSAAAWILGQLPGAVKARHCQTIAFPQEAIDHGGRSEIMADYGLSVDGIKSAVLQNCQVERKIYDSLAKPSEA